MPSLIVNHRITASMSRTQDQDDSLQLQKASLCCTSSTSMHSQLNMLTTVSIRKKKGKGRRGKKQKKIVDLTSSTASDNSFSSIDYSLETDDYESPDDIDTVAFMQADFEDVFAQVKHDELRNNSREELLFNYTHLNSQFEYLSDKLQSMQDTDLRNKEVMNQNADLQQENKTLKDELSRLTTRLRM